jgi:hypothetical protein
MAFFDFLNPGGVRPVTVRDISKTRALPPAGGGLTAPRGARPLGINPLMGAYAIPGFGEQKAQNRADVIQMSRGPLNELQYIGGQLLQGRVPYGKPAVGSIPPSANGESYRRAELRLADAARPGGGGGGGGNAGYSGISSAAAGSSPAAERAYQQEVSRVAQLTAQDPELQRYEAARQKAVAAGPGSAAEQSAEDMGMQMWAKANPKLAAKVKPGQSGYDAIQRSLNAGQMGAPADLGAFTGAAPAGFLGNSGAPATSSYTGVTPVNLGMGAIGPNALTNAYNMQTASSFNKFMEGPTLSSQPLGAPTASTGEVPTYSQLNEPQSYGLGSIPGEEETFGSDASQKFANTYAKKLLNFQPI